MANTVDTYTFTQTVDMSTIGAYSIKYFTALVADQNLVNDTVTEIINHIELNDIGVTIINNPSTDNNMSLEAITVTLENFGSLTQSNFDIAYQINGGTPVVETFTGSIATGATAMFNFNTQGDFTNFNVYDIAAYTLLTTDADNNNDTATTSIENSNCAPASNCQFGDGISLFKLGTTINPSGCTPGGYSDYTHISIDLFTGYSHDVTISSNWSPQFASIWIDYNDNFFFDANEKVVDAFQFNNNGTTAFFIDASEAVGSHLLRVKASDNANDTGDPCADMSYGETQDYTVNLISDLAIPESQNTQKIGISSLGNGQFIIDAKHFTTTAQLKIHSSLGQLVLEKQVSVSELKNIAIDLSALADGPYLIHLQNSEKSEVVKIIR